MKLFNLRKTVACCPNVWEGKDGNGNEVYIRYRGNELSINWTFTDIPYSGAINERELQEKMAGLVEFNFED